MSQAAMMRNQQIMQQRAVAFKQWSDVMMHQHEKFTSQMASEGATRMDVFHASQVAKDTAASDWVDYALNEQTVSCGGNTAKVASSAATTWTNGRGQRYQSADPGANLNGVISGTWMRGTVVHGKGQSN